MGIYEDDFKSFSRYWAYGTPLPEKRDDALTMGSIIDTLLTTPEEFNDRFIIYQGNAPKGQMLSFCLNLASSIGKPEDNFQTAYNAVGFKRDDITKVIERFEPYRAYYDYLLKIQGKQVLTIEQHAKAHIIVDELTHGKYTRPYVIARTRNDEKAHLEVFHQLELYESFQGLDIKGALDKVILNHKTKTITPIDFKSSYSVEGFRDSYIKWRYYRQGSFYTYLVTEWALKKGLGDYRMIPFRFIVCSTSGGKHYIYQMDSCDLDKARSGGYIKTGTYIKGWEPILNEILYLQNLGDWEYPYEAVINNGVIPLNIFKHEQQ